MQTRYTYGQKKKQIKTKHAQIAHNGGRPNFFFYKTR